MRTPNPNENPTTASPLITTSLLPQEEDYDYEIKAFAAQGFSPTPRPFSNSSPSQRPFSNSSPTPRTFVSSTRRPSGLANLLAILDDDDKPEFDELLAPPPPPPSPSTVTSRPRGRPNRPSVVSSTTR